ncbi:protein rigor mortis-like [Teleopsis dalmanni]|uniref:protein rigor mortis-like n=1 Tax=Teleopsis dalmanni TaxID=139649 RepID=UPI0018CD7023|nr:protein rigor mortis-like [Teleopsis dalmanni]
MAETLTRFPANPVGKVFKSCPNGALIYSGFRSINYVAIFENQNPTVECFYTRQPINEISVDPKWPVDDGVNSRRYFSVLFEDNIVQVWDFEKGCPLYGHKAHVQQSHVEGKGDKFKIVLMDFMSNSNLMTLDSQDVIVLCCSSQNYIKRRNFLNLRSDKLLSLSCSQFNANIFAVGTIRGVVYVCDVQKSAVIHALRGHRETAISSIVWHCFSQNTSKEQETDDDKVLDISVNKDLNNECKQLANTKSDDIFSHCLSQNASKKQEPNDGEVLDTHINKDINNDCVQLAITKSDDCFSQEEELNKDEQCQSSEKNIAHNKSLSSDESLATICSSSDDEIAVEGDPNLLKTKVLYKAQVHASLGGSDKSNQSIDKVGITPEDTVEVEEPKDNISKSKEFADESDYDLIKKHIMLTSVSAYNGTYCVWNFENGKLCDSIKTPGQILNPKRQLSVNWKNEHTIIGISKEGEIMSWTCDPPTYDDQNSNISLKFTKDKQLNLNFAADAICYDNNKEIIWCRGGSRQIICFDLVTKKVLASFNTVCNGIYDIKECPDDMNKILLGFCDHSFGLLDIVKLSPTNINIQSLCRADLVVNCITWSPDCLSFAYGTNEGTVGVVNVDNKKHIFQTNSVGNKPIYTLDWETENCLYINYKDKIAMMDLKSKTKGT